MRKVKGKQSERERSLDSIEWEPRRTLHGSLSPARVRKFRVERRTGRCLREGEGTVNLTFLLVRTVLLPLRF